MKGINAMQIGFIGTGTMGIPIARCLIRAGHSLSVYDHRSETTAELCAQGAGLPQDWGSGQRGACVDIG
jgi:3-hydroxyisobutyrate dehydrogenase-like beta-hydroxyacid dehydrogenase